MEVMTTLERQIQRNRRLLDSDPNNVDLMLTYALDCLRRDLRFEALVTFQKALKQKETAEARLALAKIFYLQSLYHESYDELRRLFQIDSINIEGHALLHLLNDKESAPADLAQRLAFVPSRAALSDELINARNERDLYRREVQEYEAIAANGVNEPEPILLYCLKEAQKRTERVNKYLEIMNGWEPLAIDMPGFLPADSTGVKPVDNSSAVKAEETVADSNAKGAEATSESEAEAEEVHSKRGKKSRRKRNKDNRHNQAQASENNEIEPKEDSQAAPEVAVPVATSESPAEAVPTLEPSEDEKASEPETKSVPAVETENIEPVTAPNIEVEPDGKEVATAASDEADTNEAAAAEAVESSVEGEPEAATETPELVEAAVASVEEAQAEAEVDIPTEEDLAREAMFAEPLANMCRIKGSVRAIIFTLHGRLVSTEGEFEGAEALAVKAADCLKAMSCQGKSRLSILVSESKACSIIMQQISDSYYILVDGRSITLGVLRQRVERCRTELAGFC